MSNKVMVLGGGGWLGTRVVERLVAAGRPVICADVRVGDRFAASATVESIEGDLRETARLIPRLNECVAVFNCAGLLHPSLTKDIYEVNRDLPVAVFKECMARGVKAFVHVSSINACGENPSPTTFLDESMPPRPITHYGLSKAESEAALKALAGAGQTRLVMLRPGVFYGERPSKNLIEFMDKLRTSKMPLFSDRGFLRTYVDVEKVVDAILLGEHNGVSGEAYLIGDEDPLSTLRFYQVVAEELGTTAKTLRVPLAAARVCEKLALWAGTMDRHLRLFTIVGEFGRNTFGTSAKAQRELGFVPHASSEEGLRAMVRSVR